MNNAYPKTIFFHLTNPTSICIPNIIFQFLEVKYFRVLTKSLLSDKFLETNITFGSGSSKQIVYWPQKKCSITFSSIIIMKSNINEYVPNKKC